MAEVVAHELEWFGDLVTMKWWDDLWLNESFATFMAYKTLAQVFPEWTIAEGLMPDSLDSMNLAFSEDQLKATHPISRHGKQSKRDRPDIRQHKLRQGRQRAREMIEDYAGK